jgi:hypothetical protein
MNYHPFGYFHPHQIRIVTMNFMRYTRPDAVLRCGLKRVDAVRTGSIQSDIDTELKYLQKVLTMAQKVFFTESSGIDTGYDAGLYG